MQKFLIIQTSFIGDVVLATALIEKIRSYYPDAAIDFMLRKGNESILAHNPNIRHLYIWDKKKNKLQNLLKIAGKVRKQHYDTVVNVHRGITSGFMTCYSGAKERRGFKKNPFSRFYTHALPHAFSSPDNKKFVHETERNQSLIADITDAQPSRPGIYPSDYDYQLVEEFKTRPYICIAPSSVWETKRYPALRWIELLDSLPESYSIYLLGAKDDGDLAAHIAGMTKHKGVVNLCGKLSMMQSAALMRDAAMNYTNDSAPMHFASALNAPTTAIYCSTHPCFGFGPLADRQKTVQVEDLYCKPCGLHGYHKCPQGHFRCANEIQNESLLWWISATT